MKATSYIHLAALLAALLLALPAHGQSVPVAKTNPLPVYMHYMPWFQTPSSQGGTGGSQWGWHWKMDKLNPNVVDSSGKRQIASHYYPKIGPYDSSDPAVIEYHSLLMKYSGVDGVMIDWYGVQGANGDVGSLLASSNALINKTNNFGLKFGVVAEDNFWTVSLSNTTPDINKAKANLTYLKDNYFNQSNYIRHGANNDPLMYVFGPQRFETEAQWTQIFSDTGTNPQFVTLEYQMGDAGANADGEYAWPYQTANTTNHLTHLNSFYRNRAPTLNVAGGVAYPGFHDFYQQGVNGGQTLFYIPENNGQTLTDTLNIFTQYNSNQYSGNLDMLQLATFNDFGEGTMFEPTVETGFNYLRQIQTFTGAMDPVTNRPLDESDLQTVYELYLARKKYAGNASIQGLLNQVSGLLASMQISAADSLLAQASPAGDYNADGLVTLADYTFWRSQFGTSTIIYGSGADGNYDGAINAADYIVWRNSFDALAGGAGFAATGVPEPTTAIFLGLAGVALCCLRSRRGF